MTKMRTPFKRKKVKNLNFLPKVVTTTECKENLDSVPNEKIPTVTFEIQGYKKVTYITDEISTLPLVEITKPNISNESSQNQYFQPLHLQINHYLK